MKQHRLIIVEIDNQFYIGVQDSDATIRVLDIDPVKVSRVFVMDREGKYYEQK